MRSVKVTHRDEQLLLALVDARCLSRAQVDRLFFPGRAAGLIRARLSKLTRGESPYLRRLTWYDRDGQNLAYSLGPEGVRVAEGLLQRELEVAREDIGAEYLEHHVLLSELYVGLLAAPMEAGLAKVGEVQRNRQQQREYARATHPGFRWLVTGDLELPWKQVAGAKLEARVIRPDAILELPGSRRRVFVEAETGSHSIGTSNAAKVGATINKIERYEAYCSLPSSGGTGRSWYAERYQDGFRPEVLFLVPNDVRRKSVQRLIDDWRRKHVSAACTFRAATVEQELAALVSLVWPGVKPVGRPDAVSGSPVVGAAAAPGGSAAAATSTPGPLLSREDVRTLRLYFGAAQADFKARREKARAMGKPAPEYPNGAAEMHALIERVSKLIAG